MPKVINPEKIKKIMVIQLSPFGDVFLSSVVFEPLKQKFPNAELYYLCKDPFQETSLDNPYIDHFIIEKQKKGLTYFIERLKLFYKVRKYKFDISIDIQNNPGSQQISLISGAKVRIGREKGQFSFVHTHKAKRGKPRYHPFFRLEVLAPLGIASDKFTFHYKVDALSQEYIDNWLKEIGIFCKDFIAISPSSPIQRKKWKLENFAVLCDLIHEKYGYSIVLMGTDKEKADCEYVKSISKYNIYISPKTTLRQASAILIRAKLFVCNEGGMNHISCATETKTLAIRFPSNPYEWDPGLVFSHHHHLQKAGSSTLIDNSFGISPEEALQKIGEILAGD